MANIKRFKEFVNENIENNEYITDIFNEYGKNPTEEEVATYCFNNYEKITDYPIGEIDESDLEDEISEIGQTLNLDYSRFKIAWKKLVNNED